MVAATRTHPRIRQRRDAVARTDERRRWIRTGVVLALLGVASLVLALARTTLADVDDVAVLGADRADRSLLEELVGVERGVQLIDVDLEAVEARVERHPWVAEAHATRDWPGTLRVEVVERVPVAATPVSSLGPVTDVHAASAYALVDLEGVIVDVVDTLPASMAVVRGVDVDPTPGLPAPGLVAAVRVVDAIPADLRAWVVAVDEGEAGEVDLELVDGVEAHLGAPDRLADKLVALATLLTRVQSDCITSFDVQAPDAPVVTRCAPLTPDPTSPEAS